MAARRELSLAALTVLELDPLSLIQCAESAGFDAVGLRLVPATPDEVAYATVGRSRLVRALRERLDDSPLRVRDIEIVRLQPNTRVDHDYEAMLETGAYLGASEVLVACQDPDRRRLSDTLAELASLAATYRLTPNVEFMPWTEVPDLASAAALLRDTEHDNLGLLIDSIHFDRSGSDPADLAEMPQRWFRYFQLCDADPAMPVSTEEMIRQARSDRRLPGEGGLDLLGPLRLLPATIPISIEAPLADPNMPPDEKAARARRAAERVLEGLIA